MRHRLAPLLALASLLLLAACGQRGTDAPTTPATGAGGDAAPRVQALGPSPWRDGRHPLDGVDYVQLPQATPYAPQPGRIEVVEVFGYACIHCANLQPLVNGWKDGLGEDVDLVYLPAAFGGPLDVYARAFYAAEITGVLADTHDAMYEAIHRERSLPVSAEAGPAIVAWHAARGTDPERFAAAMDNFGVNAALSRSRQVMQRWGIQATPTFVVAGRYRAEATREGGLEGLLHTVSWLVERERAAAATEAEAD